MPRSFLAVLLLLTCLGVLAQPGSLDDTFMAFDTGFERGEGPNSDVHRMVELPNGDVLLLGAFWNYDGIPRRMLARTDAHGALVPSFNPGDGPAGGGGELRAAALPDGDILLGGGFTLFSGVPCGRVVRLNSDGSLDAGFNAAGVFSQAVNNIAVQADGKVLVSAGTVLRLNADGTIDPTFDATTAGGHIQLAALPDGRILVDGTKRLLPDGTLDPGFVPDVAALGTIRAAVQQPDGKTLLADGSRIVRLLADGTSDPTFSVGSGFANAQGAAMVIDRLALQSDGRTIVLGTFDQCDGQAARAVARLDLDGSLDHSWELEMERADLVSFTTDLLPLSDGGVLVCGSFERFHGIRKPRLLRLLSNGRIDDTFNLGTGFNDRVQALALQPDGRVIVGGWFNYFRGERHAKLIRLHPDGTPDAAFNIGTGANGAILTVLLQPDGKIIAGGNFDRFNGQLAEHLVRLHPDGSVDATFQPVLPTGTASVTALLLQPDGRIVVGHNAREVPFMLWSGTTLRGGIARLDALGAPDPAFQAWPDLGMDSGIHALALSPGGKIVLGGKGLTVDGSYRHEIARLNADGSLDPSFTLEGNTFLAPALNQPLVRWLQVLPDDDVLVGGRFSQYNGHPASGIARLDAQGGFGMGASGLDMSSGVRWTGAVCADGSIFTGHERYSTTGAHDPVFDAGTGYQAALYKSVEAIALQPDGKALVGGFFTRYNGTSRSRLARIELGVVTGMSQANDASHELAVFPNPSTGLLTVRATNAMAELTITDVTGRTIAHLLNNSSAHEHTIDLSAYPPGTYVCSVRYASGTGSGTTDRRAIVLAD